MGSLPTKMLESFNPISKFLPVGNDIGVVGVFPKAISEFEFVSLDVVLQLKTKQNFIALNDKIWKYGAKEFARFIAGSTPHVLRTMIRVAFGMIVNVGLAAKLFVQSLYDRLVRHADSNDDLPTNMFGIWFLPSSNSGIAFAIEKSSGVSKFHNFSVAVDMTANSVDTQNGQYRAKQAERPGVCREHVPSPKGKICSELGRNVETPAEMIGGHSVVAVNNLHHEPTDCNTNYIFFRPHKDRNFVPIGGERQSVNQDAIVKLIGWAGNITSSGPQFCGVLIA